MQVSGLWIQDWSGKIVTEFGTRVFWNWRWNETWYPNLDTVIADLKQEGVRVTAYITPHLNVDGDVFKEHEEVQTDSILVKPIPNANVFRTTIGSRTLITMTTPSPKILESSRSPPSILSSMIRNAIA